MFTSGVFIPVRFLPSQPLSGTELQHSARLTTPHLNRFAHEDTQFPRCTKNRPTRTRQDGTRCPERVDPAQTIQLLLTRGTRGIALLDGSKASTLLVKTPVWRTPADLTRRDFS